MRRVTYETNSALNITQSMLAHVTQQDGAGGRGESLLGARGKGLYFQKPGRWKAVMVQVALRSREQHKTFAERRTG